MLSKTSASGGSNETRQAYDEAERDGQAHGAAKAQKEGPTQVTRVRYIEELEDGRTRVHAVVLERAARRSAPDVVVREIVQELAPGERFVWSQEAE